MKAIRLPTAEERRDMKTTEVREKGKSMGVLARNFINRTLRKAILEAEGNCVNEEIPIDAYKDIELFVTTVKGYLRPLGYSVERSHDGGGMYDTVFVSWE